IRYHLTFLCGFWVDISQVNYGCTETAGPQTCRSSVQAYSKSVQAVFANAKYCNQSPGTAALNNRKSLISTADSFAQHVLNTQNCIPAAPGTPETSNCGFYDNPTAITYCTSIQGSETCCSTVAGFQAPSVAPSVSSSATQSTDPNTPSSSTSNNQPAAQTSTTDGTIFGMKNAVFIGALVGGVALLIAVVVGVSMFVRRAGGRRKKANSIDLGYKSNNNGGGSNLQMNNMEKDSRIANAGPAAGGYGQQQQQQQPMGNFNSQPQQMPQQQGYGGNDFQQQQQPQGMGLPAGIGGGMGAMGGSGVPAGGEGQMSETM
ncbi:hypothetical protein HDU76_009593, partial [Blyttiomyces sp. JEL0837]